MKRRDFIKTAVSAAALAPAMTFAERSAPAAVQKKTVLPRRRGFNLLNMFLPVGNTFKGSGNYDLGAFREEDFAIIKEWGFDFVRLPLCYWCWSSEDDWFRMDEKPLKQIDQAVEWGRQYGIHVNINFHRAPGSCVNPDPVIKLGSNLLSDEAPLEAFCYQWAKFAERYRGIPSSQLSFDLLNEPPKRNRDGYIKVVRDAVKAIRDADPDRLVCADGFDYGNVPIGEFADIENFYQSARGYSPHVITHFRARWMPHLMNFPEEKLKWPIEHNGKFYDKNALAEMYEQNWGAWERGGGAVHVGEFGCHNQTPPQIANAWFRDILEVYKQRNWGWALWRLRGSFGVLDSERVGVRFENFGGAKLDRELLEILKQG